MAETDTITEPQTTLSTQNTLVMQEPLLAKSETPPVRMVEEVGDPPKERNGAEETPEHASKIRYTAECISRHLQAFDVSQNEPFPSQARPDNDAADPILEVITRMWVDLDKNFKQPEDKVKANTLEGKIIQSVVHTRMFIRSAQLSKTIREMIDYYPDQNTAGESITIFHPYGVLAHHWERLVETHKRLRASASESESERTDCEHLGVLIEFMSPIMRTEVDPIRRRLENKSPTAIWDDLWYVLRPGTKSYCKHDDQWMGCIITGTDKEEADDEEGLPERWLVNIWFLCVHKWRGTLVTVTGIVNIPKYEGEKNILDLNVYPQAYFDAKDGGARRRKFEERGSRIFGILKTGHEYANYDGEFMDTKKSKYKGPIIISPFGDTESDSDVESDEWDFDILPEPSDPNTPETAASEILPQLWLDPKKDSEDLMTAAHKAIVCPVLGAFVLPRKTWAPIHITHVRPLDSDADIPDAILSDNKLKIVNALAERQMTNRPWSADFIKNKGEGVVILLHGPPGVGKTYTVESIAMKKRQPLISLSISEIGIQEATLETSLTRWFSMAEKWHAILLIDECDIFLERREHKDIHRNGVVSAFLRKMEYFGGLLFLTTNRVLTIDDAFVSRVHAIIEFENLDGARRDKIWDNLLKKLARERKGEIRVSNLAKRFLKTPDVLETSWNGREIRNAFKTAIALAEYEAKGTDDYDEQQEIIVEAEHFKEVLDMSKAFQSYLKSHRNRSEAQRAKFANWRNDEWKEGDDEKGKGKK